MLASGTHVVGSYCGRLNDGTVIAEVGTVERPQTIVIGDYGLPANVSNALATMREGEQRVVKAPYILAKGKGVVATYDVSLAFVERLSAVDDERMHGGECACGCHKIRKALMR